METTQGFGQFAGRVDSDADATVMFRKSCTYPIR